ncbi:hypothetical protein [Pseudogracilibacillus auburnensis]|uniref:hypothetical protein n=1 Tax=Pseudogracilibacillus auburnensis TaxID=1494959 RepID=UPI001A97B3F3|nr:hypothetical protein [Pseudogracilibacillus auburnensis]MBO1002852.1 hypothetical protein [Pseudogracilibacillus auburnensis]
MNHCFKLGFSYMAYLPVDMASLYRYVALLPEEMANLYGHVAYLPEDMANLYRYVALLPRYMANLYRYVALLPEDMANLYRYVASPTGSKLETSNRIETRGEMIKTTTRRLEVNKRKVAEKELGLDTVNAKDHYCSHDVSCLIQLFTSGQFLLDHSCFLQQSLKKKL